MQISERQAAILEERLALALDELAHTKLECARHCTALHGTARHGTALHCTALHCTAAHIGAESVQSSRRVLALLKAQCSTAEISVQRRLVPPARAGSTAYASAVRQSMRCVTEYVRVADGHRRTGEAAAPTGPDPQRHRAGQSRPFYITRLNLLAQREERRGLRRLDLITEQYARGAHVLKAALPPPDGHVGHQALRRLPPTPQRHESQPQVSRGWAIPLGSSKLLLGFLRTARKMRHRLWAKSSQQLVA